MKYLSDYYDDAVGELLEETGAFFAFGNEQLEAQARETFFQKVWRIIARKKKHYQYVSMQGFGGLVCPRRKAREFVEKYMEIIATARKRDEEENGRRGIIARELSNHECYYTWDLQPAVDVLQGYWDDLTLDEIQEVWKEERPKWEAINC